MLAAVSLPLPPLTTFCWQPDARFRCSIQSDDAEVIEQARLVFAASALPSSEAEDAANLQWRVERPEAGGEWHAQPLTSATPDIQSGSLELLLVNIEYRTLQALLARGTDSFFALHAALLSKNGRSVIIVGPKEAGKSTLSCALWAQRGWTLRCDDSVLVSDDHLARPTPRRVSLRNGSRALLGESLWERLLELPSTLPLATGLLFHPHELETAPTRPILNPPSALFFLARRESSAGSAQTVALPAALAALALLPYSTFLLPRGEELLRPSGVDWGQSLPRLARFAARVPAFDLGRGPLDEMTREVERLAFHANPVSAS